MRSSRTWFVLSAALAAFALTASADDERRPSDWREFSPAGGRFAVALPGRPAIEHDETATPVGTVHMTKYWVRVGDVLLAVEMHDLPPVASALLSDDMVLDQARAGLLDDVGGTQIESKSLTYRGSPARDFRYRVAGTGHLEERVLAVLVDARLYLVTGMARAPQTDPDVARFLESFRYWR
jgi:hypothetical protein